MSPEILSLHKVEDNDTLTVSAFLEFDDVNSKNEETHVLSILGTNDEVWCMQSATAKRSFFDMVSIFGNDNFTIKKISGETKAGREYVNLTLA
jgi:hypothetical protein